MVLPEKRIDSQWIWWDNDGTWWDNTLIGISDSDGGSDDDDDLCMLSTRYIYCTLGDLVGLSI